MSNEVQFLPSIYFKEPNMGAPSFVKLRGSIRVDKFAELVDLLREKRDAGEEWLNFDIKESKEGKIYASIDNWKPTKENLEKKVEQIPTAAEAREQEQEDLPF